MAKTIIKIKKPFRIHARYIRIVLYVFLCKEVICFFFCFFFFPFSGQVHIIASDHDDSDEEYAANVQPPKIMSLPNTSRLDVGFYYYFMKYNMIFILFSILQKSEISLATKQACGLREDSGNKNLSIASMIQKRSLGSGFSIGEKCRISSNFLPNKSRQVAKYNSKVFCGSYSKDGRFFLTASQGNISTCIDITRYMKIMFLLLLFLHR